MNLVFINHCAADGCYKLRIKDKAFCKEHEKQIQEGKTISAWYGKKVKIQIKDKSFPVDC